MKKVVRASISLEKEYKKKLTYLAELEHRRLNQQIIHMTEFYLNHKIETKELLERFTKHQLELEALKPNLLNTITNTPIENKARPPSLKTSQVLQETKGIIISDVPEKKIKSGYNNLSS